jgi:hypothetical protein
VFFFFFSYETFTSRRVRQEESSLLVILVSVPGSTFLLMTIKQTKPGMFHPTLLEYMDVVFTKTDSGWKESTLGSASFRYIYST